MSILVAITMGLALAPAPPEPSPRPLAAEPRPLAAEHGPATERGPVDGPVDEPVDEPVERYDWRSAIRGEGELLSPTEFANRVVRTSPSIEAARAAAEQASAAAEEVRMAFVPRVDASLRYTRLFQRDNRPIAAGPSAQDVAAVDAGLAQVQDPAAAQLIGGLYEQLDAVGDSRFPVIRNQYGLRVQLTYPLSDVFTTLRSAQREARSAARASEAMERATESEVRLRAHEAYYGYVRARALAAVADASLRRAESQLGIIEASERLGEATRADVLRVKARVSGARVGRAAAEAGVATGQEAMRTLAHFERRVDIAVSDPMTDPPRLTAALDTLQERGLAERDELQAADALLDARRDGLARTRRDMAPKLALVAGVDTARPNQRILPLADQFDTSADASVVLSWSPNQLLVGTRRAKQARAAIRRAAADERALIDGVKLEVAGAYFAYRQAYVSADEATVSVDAAQESYRARLAQWRGGAARVDELIEADAEVTRAQTDLVDASVGVALARARLTRAVGRIDAADFAR